MADYKLPPMPRGAAIQATNHAPGWRIEWYRDDDNNSGWGDNAEICYWYGTFYECVERVRKAPPKDGWHEPDSDTS